MSQGSDIVIRPARVEEAGFLTDLAMRSKASNGYDDAFMDACRGELKITATSFNERHFEVAEAEGRVLGFYGLWPRGEDGTVEVDPAFVEPELKRSGVGRLLWQALEETARKWHASAIKLDADPAAVPFYEAMGAMVVGEKASGSIPGRMLPHMRKDLL